MVTFTAQSGRSSRRSGFTLIELLVVLAIITILLSISWAVYGTAVESARADATRATIRQLDSALQERHKAFQRVNLKSQAKLFKSRYDNSSPVNNPAAVSLEVAEIIVRKDRFKAAFPQRLEDLWGFDGVANTSDDAPLWAVWKAKTGFSARNATAPDPFESSELLYLALTNGGSFGAPTLTLDKLRAQHVRDANGNGLNEIYDEWGFPLRFYNWPTRLVRPGGETSAGPPIDLADITVANFRAAALPLMPTLPKITSDLSYDFNTFVNHQLNIDPQDPTGALLAAQNATTPGIGRNPFTLGSVTNQRALTEEFYGTFDTYSLPLIVSAGPDGQLGLTEPALAGTGGQARLAEPTGSRDFLYDNITNAQP